MAETGCNHTYSGGGQGRQQRPEYTMGALTALEVQPSAFTTMAIGSCHRHMEVEVGLCTASGLAAGEHSDIGQ